MKSNLNHTDYTRVIMRPSYARKIIEELIEELTKYYEVKEFSPVSLRQIFIKKDYMTIGKLKKELYRIIANRKLVLMNKKFLFVDKWTAEILEMYNLFENKELTVEYKREEVLEYLKNGPSLKIKMSVDGELLNKSPDELFRLLQLLEVKVKKGEILTWKFESEKALRKRVSGLICRHIDNIQSTKEKAQQIKEFELFVQDQLKQHISSFVEEKIKEGKIRIYRNTKII